MHAAGRVDGTDGDPANEKKPKKQVIHSRKWNDALSAAAYFSLISAVNIGFEQFTPGDWIRRLQRREYSLVAVGWVRVVSGAQSLLSLYLLAMWVLSLVNHSEQSSGAIAMNAAVPMVYRRALKKSSL